MKILYLANRPLPSVALDMKSSAPAVGGWIIQTIENMAKANDVVFCFPNSVQVASNVNGFKYFGFTKNGCLELFKKIICDEQPDVIHIFGSEYKHSLIMSEAAKAVGFLSKIVLSLQGLIGECAKVYTYGVPQKIVAGKTIGDIIRGYNIQKQQQNFEVRGQDETYLLQNINNVIGRTAWDKQVALGINSKLNYFHCGETLREEFYASSKWDSNKCKSHTLFISQNDYPIKGFHLLLDALRDIVKQYPDLIINTTGKGFNGNGIMGKLKQSSFQRFITSKIKANGLCGHIRFLGQLNAQQMVEQYLSCNAFVSSSVLENSPNSVGEAMLLGVPIICSNVGGCDSIISEQEGALYDLEDNKTLTEKIKNLFDNPSIYADKSIAAIKRAEKQYSVKDICGEILNIYNEVIRND